MVRGSLRLKLNCGVNLAVHHGMVKQRLDTDRYVTGYMPLGGAFLLLCALERPKEWGFELTVPYFQAVGK